MSHKVGEKHAGAVSSVTEFGLFVELQDFYVDGLVHITSLGQDYYRFDADRRQLVGESSGRIYKIGQALEVQVARVDMEQGRIDFSLTDVSNEKFSGKSRKKNSYGSNSGKTKSGKSKSGKSKASKSKAVKGKAGKAKSSKKSERKKSKNKSKSKSKNTENKRSKSNKAKKRN